MHIYMYRGMHAGMYTRHTGILAGIHAYMHASTLQAYRHICRHACHKFIYLFIMMDATDFDDDEVGARAELAMVVAETTDHVATLGEIDRLSEYIVGAAHSESTKTNYEGAFI